MAITAGLYEIRSMLLTSMAVDVAGASAVKGANVLIYSNKDGNNQKFRLTEETSGHWSIQSASSGLYVDVAQGAARNGANVQQWTSNNQRNQRWNIVETGSTVTIDGVSCPVVTIGSYVTADGATYMMDVDHAMTTNSTNVLIWSANGGDNQKFALLPTTLLDQAMPVPMGLGWSEAVGEQGQLSLPEAAKLYPCWQFTEAWGALSGHGFEISTRTRSIPDDSATPTEWSGWSAWSVASVTTSDGTAWLTSGITADVPSGSKALEVGIRVRPTGTSGGSAVHGSASSAVLTALFAPTVSASSVALGPDALVVTLSSDYTGGTTTATITSIADNGVEYLARPVSVSGTGSTISGTIPIGSLADIPGPDAISSLEVACSVGTDQYAPRGSQTSTATYAWASTMTLPLVPTLDWASVPASVVASHTVGTKRRGWLFADGEAWPLDNGNVIPYPFGRTCTYYLSGEKSDGTAFGGYVDTIDADDANRHAPCHAWNWDGRTLLLEATAGGMETSRTIKASADELDLDQRPWQVVAFSETLSSDLEASGALFADSDWSVLDLLALMRAHHALYRAPSGEVAYVGVTNVQYSTTSSMTDVDVTMTQEAR